MLGVACLVSALFFFWDTVTRWPERKQRRTRRIILVNAAFFAMSVWLLYASASTTSTVCLALGCLVVVAASSKVFRRRPRLLKVLLPATFFVYLILGFVFGLNGAMAQAMGKDPTLHDRTKIWGFLLSMHTNPVIGTGYQSFWLGPRLTWFWNNSNLGHINEAHNGFLEIYLELGILGILCIIALLVATYREICRRFDNGASLATLGLALWIVLLFYNMSEASLEGGLLYMAFLMTAITVPASAKVPVRSPAVTRHKAVFENQLMQPSLPNLTSKPAPQRR